MVLSARRFCSYPLSKDVCPLREQHNYFFSRIIASNLILSICRLGKQFWILVKITAVRISSSTEVLSWNRVTRALKPQTIPQTIKQNTGANGHFLWPPGGWKRSEGGQLQLGLAFCSPHRPRACGRLARPFPAPTCRLASTSQQAPWTSVSRNSSFMGLTWKKPRVRPSSALIYVGKQTETEMQAGTDHEPPDWGLSCPGSWDSARTGSRSELSVPLPRVIACRLFSLPEQRPLLWSHHTISAATCLEPAPPIWVWFSEWYTGAIVDPAIKC